MPDNKFDPTLWQQQASQVLQQAVREKRPDPNYAAPPNLDEQIAAMKNSDQLTPFERSVYKVLPGFSQSSFGQALAKFNDSWAGKALQYLDFAAEGFERTLGLMAQIGSPDYNPGELKAAWYAGSLAADVTDLPTLKWQDGKIVGLSLPDELPGVAGLTQARHRITELMQQGKTGKEALGIAREELYGDLGALALRSQLYDTYFHIAADPLNYIMPALKPVEALQARRVLALTSKIGYTAEELVTKADDLKRLASLATDAAEATRYMDEATQLAEIAGKVGRGEFRGMNTLDKVAVMLTGGDPFRPTKFSQAISKVPILNMFQLTPESKAKELLTLLTDNLGTGIVQRVFNQADAEKQFVEAVHRINKGSTGIEFGHALVSVEGRTAQSFLNGADVKVTKIFEDYVKLAPDRDLAKILSESIGTDVTKMLKQAGNNPDALLRQITAKAAQNPVLAEMLQRGELTADRLSTLAQTLKGVPHSKEMFFAVAMDAIEETAMRQAVVQFGVKARGTMTRWADAVKSAESLAFLRLNPGYPIRNAINNDVTMLARGVFGMMTPGMIDDFWKGAGFIPPRMAEGFTQAEMAGTNLGKASAVLDEALKGGNFGAPEKVKEFFQQLNLGKMDTAGWGRGLEAAASKRAFTTGYIQFIRRHGRLDSVATKLDRATLDAVEGVAPELVKVLDDAIRSSGGFENKLDDILKSNLNLNVDSVLDEASRTFGADVRELMGDEVLEFMHKGLPDAIANGKTEEFVFGVRGKIDAHLEDLFQKQLENVVEHVKAQVQAGGPQTFYKYAGEAQDIFWSAHAEHAYRMPSITDSIRAEPDMKVANALWNRLAEDDRKFFDRAFRRVDAYAQAMEQGAKEVGLKFPREVRTYFREWRSGWEDFFKKTNAEKRAFFDMKLKGQEYQKGWDQIVADNKILFDEMTAREDEIMRGIDEAIAGQIPNGEMRTAFLNTRDAMAELRRADKQKVSELFQQAQNLPAAERQKLFNQFWAERQQSYAQMRDMDSASRAVMNGDPKATQMFAGPAPMEAAEGGQKTVYQIASEYGIPSASPSGARNDRRILDTVNKYMPQEAAAKPPEEVVDAVQDIADDLDIPEDLALNALDDIPEGSISGTFDAAGTLTIDGKTIQASRGAQKTVFDTGGDTVIKIDSVDIATKKNSPVLSEAVEMQAAPRDLQKYLPKVVRRGQIVDTEGKAHFFVEVQKVKPLAARSELTVFDSAAEQFGDKLQEAYRAVTKYFGEGDIRGLDNWGVTDDGEYVLMDVVNWNKKASRDAAREAREFSQRYGAAKGNPIVDELAKNKLLEMDYEDIASGAIGKEEVIDRLNKIADVLPERKAEITEVVKRLEGLGDQTAKPVEVAPQALKYTSVADIPEDVARAAFEARAAEKGTQVPQKAISQQFMADISKILPDPMPVDLGQDLTAYGRTYGALDMIVEGAKRQGKKTPVILENLPDAVKAKVMRALEQSRGDMSTLRFGATRFAEFRRDSALLNYNRRTNFDMMVGNVFPFAFWTTGSVQKWAIESIDRPAMLTSYLRTKKFMETSGLENEGMPSRIRGKLRIPLPFAPEWMGDQFVDPMRLLLPFDSFAQPFAQYQQAQTTLEGRASRLLQEKLDNGEITQAEYDEAIETNSGALWEQSLAEAQQNDENMKFDAWDFATTMSSPHAPIMWAYNAASGHPESIGPFSPMSRIMRNAATMLGVEDWNNSSWNVEAKVRRQLGLPAYDKWDNYRVNRAVSDLVGTGEYSLDQVREARYLSAMVEQGKITAEQAKEMSPAYREGVKRANQEYTGGTAGGILGLLGINVTTVPEGETNLRRLSDDFGRAYEQYNEANRSLEKFLREHPNMTQEDAEAAWERANPKLVKGMDAVTRFFDEHPEYEARLGLFDPPEKQIKKFLVDQVWSQWNQYPKLNQDEIREQLGPTFADTFMDKNTRNYDALTPEQLSVWLKLMGGNPVGTLTATEQALVDLNHLNLTDPETAFRVQVFYDTRRTKYGYYYDLQNKYYSYQTKRERENFVAQNPGLREYWNWRTDFMNKNPDLVRYLTDNERAIEQAKRSRRQPQVAVPTAQELQQRIDPIALELLGTYQAGESLPPVLMDELYEVASIYGLTVEQAVNIIGAGQ